MKIEIIGTLTAGYYNDMEAGYPVFISGESLSDAVKSELSKRRLPVNFCDDRGPCWPSVLGDEDIVSNNRLIGKQVKMTLEIEE